MIRVFETFGGYGGASFGLKKAGVDFECIGVSEINKYAIRCYNQNHKGKQLGSITDIDPKELPDFDLLTGGFPCQDVSIAGKRDLSKGRTLLINDIFRIIKIKKPKYLVLENVKGLLSMTSLWDSIRYTLNNLSYGVAFKVLNSKDYGIPQNRERIFIVCKYGGWEFMEFQFPYKEKLNIFLKDILESEVDKKYYLSEEYIKKIEEKNKVFDMKGNRIISEKNDYFSGLTCSINNNDILKVHSLFPRSGNPNNGGTGHLSKSDGTSYCLDTGNCQALELNSKFRILTPKECFRLMGFIKDDINLNGISDNQCYRLAGNGWDVNLVSKIFKRLFPQDSVEK